MPQHGTQTSEFISSIYRNDPRSAKSPCTHKSLDKHRFGDDDQQDEQYKDRTHGTPASAAMTIGYSTTLLITVHHWSLIGMVSVSIAISHWHCSTTISIPMHFMTCVLVLLAYAHNLPYVRIRVPVRSVNSVLLRSLFIPP